MKNKLLKTWFYILLSFVIFHSAITVAYNFPITPLKNNFSGVINSYMTPLFSQTWTLFAPNPANTNVKAEVKLSYGDNQETSWISFSDLVHEKSRNNYFSHYHFYSGALVQMQGNVIRTSENLMKSIEEEDKQILEQLNLETANNNQSSYIEGLVEKKDIKDFLETNRTVNSLYGLVYTYFNKQYFSDISNIQIRISSEFFAEYGEEEESKYQLFYLPKLKTNQLVRGG
ncbi:DUF5819 family protein [Lentibacillus sediminis]|uniref:DUF5819 family protein n=1 Tax=Lentibacillus sediminis TaxID=1940529 RepID=UPI000C1C7320|nr:DUF5819 family protein [Lentibacillus sediminis]